VIFFNEDLNLAQKCTGCAHLLEEGWEVPRCVDACPTEALKFGTESDMKELTDKATVLNPEQGLQQRVYYLNIPGKFIAGTVYDPVEKEVIIGAQCALNNNGTTLTTTTDGFGDFWFEGLGEGDYNLTIEADGYITGNYDNINTQSDVNLGDIPLNRISR
jgi:hypothetical protein